GGRTEGIADAAWSRLGAAVDAPIRLRLACEPRRLLDWVAEAQAAARRLGVETALLAQPGHGVIQMAVWGSQEPRRVGAELVRPLRAAVEAQGGSLILEGAPAGLKGGCEGWGGCSRDG